MSSSDSVVDDAEVISSEDSAYESMSDDSIEQEIKDQMRYEKYVKNHKNCDGHEAADGILLSKLPKKVQEEVK